MNDNELTGLPRTPVQWIGLFLGIACALALYFAELQWPADSPQLPAMAAVAALMAIWWITEAIPIPATALVPLLLFPTLGIMPAGEVSLNYGHRLIFLFLGGFLVALAIEESGLHRRIALTIISFVGDQPRRMVGGFMLATALLSMWLSNTATTLMLLPIGGSVLLQVDALGKQDETQQRFGIALMLGIAYAASIGGFATLIGTPPNVAFKAIFQDTFPNEPEIGFAQWMMLALPLSLTMLVVCWLVLTRVVYPLGAGSFLGGGQVIQNELEKLGPMRPAERRMLVIFVMTAGLWIFREPVAGWGWAPALGIDKMEVNGETVRLVRDSTVAIAMALVCFIVPSGEGDRRPLLSWEATVRLPWGILLLFGGGLALAAGMRETGLAELLALQLTDVLEGMPKTVMASVVACGMTFLTELTSNLASVQMILPILASTSEKLGVDPRVLMIPATISASCAFMLPVATPPNAIVYSSGRLRIRDMVKAGIVMNFLGVMLTVIFVILIKI